MKQKLLFFKTFLLIAIMTMFGTNSWAAEVTLSAGTYDGSSITWTLNDGSTTAVTIKQLKGAGTAVNSNYISAPRVYRANLLSFEAASGYAITNISISYTSTYKGTTITSGTSMNGNDVISNTTDINQTLSTASNGTHTFASTSSAGLPAIYIQNGTTSAANTQLRITKIDVTFVTTGGGSKTSTTTSFATASYSFDINSAQYNAFTGQTASVSDGSSTISGATLTYSTTDTSVAAVNASTGAVTLGTKIGTATITASYAGDENYDGSSATYTITLTYPYVHAGTAADPFTVAEAVAKAQENGTTASGPWYTTGIVAQVDDVNTSYGNAQYWISDDGTTSGAMLEIYRGKYLDNTSFTSNDQIQVGDEVVVTGNLLNYNNSTPEYAANNYLVSLSRGGLADAEFAFPQASYTAVLGGSFTAPALSTASGYDGTPQYVSSDTGVATVDASTGAVAIVGVGTTTITASAAATSNFLAGEASYSLTVVNKLSPELTVTPATLTVTVGAADGTATVTTASGYAGNVSVSSDNSSVATATYSAGTVTVTYGSVGTATITVTAAAAGDYDSQTQTIAVTVNDVSGTLWEEYFGSYSANDVPSGGTYNYACANGGSTTKIYAEALAEGEAPELLVSKTGGSLAATVPLNGYYGTFTLSYKSNNSNLSVSSSVGTVGSATVDGKNYTLTISDVPEGTTDITITFENAKSGNSRLDNIVFEGNTQSSGSIYAPTFSPAAGAVAAGTAVTITSATGTAIKYTVDGTEPTLSNGTDYTTPITVTAPVTIKAIATDGTNISSVAEAAYTIAVTAPTFSPSAGAVDAGTTVTITADGAASIKYTTDGTDPSSSNGTTYSAPIEINDATTLKAAAFDSYGNMSEVVTAAYTIKTTSTINLTKQLVISIEDNDDLSGTYATNNSKTTLNGTWAGDASATTFDGFTIYQISKQSSFQFQGNAGSLTFPVILSAQGFDVTYVATQNDVTVTIDGNEVSGTDATSATLVLARTSSGAARLTSITLTPRGVGFVAAPTISPESGAVTAGTTVTITADGAASIKYTTDGTDPSESNGTVYTTPIAINDAMTIKAAAFDGSGNMSEVVSATYTIKVVGTINLTKSLVFVPETSGLLSSSYASNDSAESMDGTWDGDTETTTFNGFTFKDVYAPTASGVHYFQLKANSGVMTFPVINSAYGFDVVIDYATNTAVVSIDGTEVSGTSATSATLQISAGSSYCRINSITLVPRVQPTVSVSLAEVSIGADEVYAGTYYNSSLAYLMPTGMTGYTITIADGNGGVLTLNPVYAAGDEVPVGEALLITSSTSQSNVPVTIVTDPSTTKVAGNLLKGSPGAGVMISGDDNHYYYKLSKSKTTGKPGFFWGNSTGEPFVMSKDTSCYLEVAKPSSGEPIRGFSFGTDFTTAISIVNANDGTMPKAIFDLQGRRVVNAQKGIYIVNGKKVMVK